MHLMYLMDADSGTAMWASNDQNQSRGRRRMCRRLTAIPKRLFPAVREYS
jgi:hypothetical protein